MFLRHPGYTTTPTSMLITIACLLTNEHIQLISLDQDDEHGHKRRLYQWWRNYQHTQETNRANSLRSKEKRAQIFRERYGVPAREG